MKILLVHNNYQHPGGEDQVYALERSLLESHGHEVVAYQRSNRELESQSLLRRVTLPLHTIWARDSYRQMQALLRRECPDVVHVHNTFVQISPVGPCRLPRGGCVRRQDTPQLPPSLSLGHSISGRKDL